jgi:hypothetical protein
VDRGALLMAVDDLKGRRILIDGDLPDIWFSDVQPLSEEEKKKRAAGEDYVGDDGVRRVTRRPAGVGEKWAPDAQNFVGDGPLQNEDHMTRSKSQANRESIRAWASQVDAWVDRNGHLVQGHYEL